MLENMFDGVEIILGADPKDWARISARTIAYTGRPDLIRVPGQDVTFAEKADLMLPFRTLDISLGHEEWPHGTSCLHACTLVRPWTRKTSYAVMTGGHSAIISTETPREAAPNDLTPYYPIEMSTNHARVALLAAKIKTSYPNLHLLGRLGSYRYLDMYQAVGQALAFVSRHFKGQTSGPGCGCVETSVCLFPETFKTACAQTALRGNQA